MNIISIKDIKDINNNYDAIIVGTGFSGSIIARILSDYNYKVLIFEKRNHIAGNMYDFFENNCLIHKYGPHILYFDSDEVFNLLSKYTNLVKYKHKVYANVNNKIITLPLTLKGISKIVGKNYRDDLKKINKKYKGKKISIFNLMDEHKEIGSILYSLIFENYSKKMWGCDPMKLDKFVLERIPIYFKKTKNHFSNKYQFIPKNGYTKMFNNILNSDNINIIFNKDINDYICLKNNEIYFNNKKMNIPLIYTGCISELFKNKYGELSYRSLDFKIDFVKKKKKRYPTINFPSDPKITRKSNMNIITKYNKNGKINAILIESPMQFVEGFEKMYPLPLKKEKNKYELYFNESLKYNNLFLCGRLAEYRYINMENTILSAIKVAKELVKKMNYNK